MLNKPRFLFALACGLLSPTLWAQADTAEPNSVAPAIAEPAAEAAPVIPEPAAAEPAQGEMGSSTLTGNQAQAILQQMSKAVRELDYQGLVTYEFSGAIDSFRMVHKVVDGVEHERMQQLNGRQREVISRGRRLDCVAVGDQLLRGASLRLGEHLLQLSDFYTHRVMGVNRLADREVLLLSIEPRDKYRYGYIIGVDRQTSLPLMMELVGSSPRKVFERFQFVELQVGEEIEAALLEAKTDKAIFITHQNACADSEPQGPKTWQADWLPAGFVFSGQQLSSLGGDMLMYSDGLNALSIFIDRVDEGEPVIEGHSRRGATSVVMTKTLLGKEVYSVTVVGELPRLALLRIAERVRPLAAGR
ncbi:MAG: MucB/RseB C-terminal domain-containing protein [Cellvibrionaceae bacterium]|nr:MucB/RseB C-terminal domain-containing protein [Cellvibrionaceae bacterium]